MNSRFALSLTAVAHSFKLHVRALSSTGLFGLNVLSKPQGFETLEQIVYEECSGFMKEGNQKDRRKMVEILDDISNSICKVADMAECVRNLHPETDFIIAAENCTARLTDFVERLNTNTELYHMLAKSASQEGDVTDKRVARLLLEDFEASGVHLPPEKKSNFVSLSSDIFSIGAAFSRGCELSSNQLLSSNSAFGSSSINSDRVLKHDPKPAENTLDINLDRRKLSYTTYFEPSHVQEKLLKQLINSRLRLAQVSGYKSYAHRALRGSVLETPEAAKHFLISLIDVLKPVASAELQALRYYANNSSTVNIWDIPYLKALHRAEVLSNLKHNIHNEFDIRSVVNGLEFLLHKLFQIRLKRVICQKGETWADLVDKFEVVDSENRLFGSIYCDWYDRPGKATTDCHFTVRCSKRLTDGPEKFDDDERYQTPVIVLSFRYPEMFYGADKVFELTNIMHEFGHALHSVLGRTRYQHVAGTRCPTDFAEVPSHLMEFFLWDPRTLPIFASGTINFENAKKLSDVSKCFTAVELLQQAIHSLFDLEIHSIEDEILESVSTTDIYKQICTKTWPALWVPGTAWQHRFSHAVPYGAKYHSYLVAKAAASLIWREAFEDDPLNPLAGDSWREVLAYGGELPSKDLMTKILNRPLDVGCLSEALIN